jgi:hypothetical protein
MRGYEGLVRGSKNWKRNTDDTDMTDLHGSNFDNRKSMKTLRLILRHSIVPIILTFVPLVLSAQGAKAADSTVIRVLYFHGTVRCQACLTIEQYTDMTMKYRFQDQINAGKVVWKSIDYEKENDTASVNRYGLENQALILSKVVNGKEQKWKKLERIWELYGDMEKFLDYVEKTVKRFGK